MMVLLYHRKWSDPGNNVGEVGAEHVLSWAKTSSSQSICQVGFECQPLGHKLEDCGGDLGSFARPKLMTITVTTLANSFQEVIQLDITANEVA
jgi:hypothetical protein